MAILASSPRLATKSFCGRVLISLAVTTGSTRKVRVRSSTMSAVSCSFRVLSRANRSSNLLADAAKLKGRISPGAASPASVATSPSSTPFSRASFSSGVRISSSDMITAPRIQSGPLVPVQMARGHLRTAQRRAARSSQLSFASHRCRRYRKSSVLGAASTSRLE